MIKGYRVGTPQERKPENVLRFEVEESGNTPIVEYAAQALKCAVNLNAVVKAIEKRFGANAKVLWMCDTKKQALENYGSDFETGEVWGEADLYEIPDNALILCDLQDEGKLYVYTETEEVKT